MYFLLVTFITFRLPDYRAPYIAKQQLLTSINPSTALFARESLHALALINCHGNSHEAPKTT